MERRLAAILVADVVGYSRLMGEDEAGTLARLEGLKAEILDPLIAQHHGRVVKLMGDGFLVEFASVVDALVCALAWQDAVEVRASQVPEDRALRFRIGVNLGDVIVKGADVYGDGVNVAARLEGLAEPGSVLVSRTVFDHAKGKVRASFEDLGEQELKNIAEPVRVFRVSMGSEVTETPTVAKVTSRSRRLPAIAATVVLLVVAASAALWQRPWEPREEPASLEAMAFPLPDKPSIAVLPFTNMSGDPEQEYFADGITEDLITDLSKISGLFVIARNSTFSYKGQKVKVRQVAEELGVRYVLEGSVRRAGDQVRINAQLIDATTGGHLWAERYDGSLADVFALQDKVTGSIVAALAVELSPSEALKLKARGTTNPAAYDAYLLGLRHLNVIDFWRPDETIKTRNAFQNAVALDPNFAAAHSGLAWALWFQVRYSHGVTSFDRLNQMKKAIEMADKSLKLSDNALAHRLLAKQYFQPASSGIGTFGMTNVFRHDEAVTELRKAVSLEPNNADSLAELAYYLVFAGNLDEAATLVREAKRLNPNFPNWYHRPAGIAEYLSGRYEAAAEEFKAWFENDVIQFNSALWLAAALAQTGKSAKAKAALQAALTGSRRYTTTSSVAYYIPFKNQDHFNSLLVGLRKAGLPDAE